MSLALPFFCRPWRLRFRGRLQLEVQLTRILTVTVTRTRSPSQPASPGRRPAGPQLTGTLSGKVIESWDSSSAGEAAPASRNFYRNYNLLGWILRTWISWGWAWPEGRQLAPETRDPAGRSRAQGWAEIWPVVEPENAFLYKHERDMRCSSKNSLEKNNLRLFYLFWNGRMWSSGVPFVFSIYEGQQQ
jgi:hypothetical protein